MFPYYDNFTIFKYAFVPDAVDTVAVTFEPNPNPISSFADKFVIMLPLNSSSVFADIYKVRVDSTLGEPLKK